MAKDEEFRKVAEDVRALARSLANDFRDAVDQSRGSGYPTSRAFKNAVRGVADEARRGVSTGIRERSRHHHHHRGHRSPPWWGPTGEGFGPASPPAAPGAPEGSPGRWPPPGQGWPRTTRPPRPKRSRSALPPVRRRWDATTVVGLIAVLFGVAWLLGAVHAVNVSIEAVVAIGLMLLGASLIVTGRTDWSLSRHSWPVWLGLGLIAVLLASSSTFGVGDTLKSVSFGKMAATPTGSGTVHGGFGNFKVDASKLAANSVLNVDSVAGQTVIDLPANTPVRLNARVLAGEICVNGIDESNGVGASWGGPIPDPGSDPSITVNVHQVAGKIQVGGKGCAGR